MTQQTVSVGRKIACCIVAVLFLGLLLYSLYAIWDIHRLATKGYMDNGVLIQGTLMNTAEGGYVVFGGLAVFSFVVMLLAIAGASPKKPDN